MKVAAETLMDGVFDKASHGSHGSQVQSGDCTHVHIMYIKRA